MADRPIIFSASMVSALLNGRKTQTRRILKLPTKTNGKDAHRIYEHPKMGGWEPTTSGGSGCFTFARDGSRVPSPERVAIWHRTCGICIEAPYQVGDRLWVRETWADVNTDSGPALSFRAGGMHFCSDDAWPVEYDRYPGCVFAMWCGDLERGEPGHAWRSPIHMPRWASRLTLTVIDVRVQRLQDITPDDIMAEGCPVPFEEYGEGDPGSWFSAGQWFEDTWKALHSPDAWSANPWVAALTFEVHRGNIDALSAHLTTIPVKEIGGGCGGGGA